MAEPATIIGRLQKKLAKTQKQRDFFRQRCEHYAEVVRLHPYMERDYKSVQERRAERERVKGLEQRITEQAMLIEKLAAAGSAALPPPPQPNACRKCGAQRGEPCRSDWATCEGAAHLMKPAAAAVPHRESDSIGRDGDA